MPEYEYQCMDCKKIFTIHMTIGEHDVMVRPACKSCGSTNVKQMLSAATVITAKKS